MNDKSEKKTLVEEGTEFVGTLRAKCPIVVRGVIEGDVEAPALSITSTGSVSGNVKAQRVDSQGVLAGSVEADQVSLAGEVRSDTVIRARALEVKLAAEKGRLEVTFGDCILDIGDPAVDHAAVDDHEPAGRASPSVAITASAEAEQPAEGSDDSRSGRPKKRARLADADDTGDVVAAQEPVASLEVVTPESSPPA